MFTVREIAYRPWPVVIVRQEANAAGEIVEVKETFIGHFLPFSEAELKAIIDESRAVQAPVADGVAAERSYAELLEDNFRVFSRVLVGWSEVRDDHKVDIPFSLPLLRSLTTGRDGMVFSAGINKALAEIRFGAVAVKNSSPSVAPGQSPGAVEAPTNFPAT